MGKTVFVTYNFEGAPYSGGTSLGLNESLHCNYIQRLETDTLTGKDLNFFFPQNEFPFINDMTGGTGFGWSATKINALVQVVDGTGSTVTAPSQFWKKIDVTDQLVGHTMGSAISQNSLQTTVFKVTFAQVNSAPYYDLAYLSIPTSLSGDTNRLGFGEEVFFFGNVKTDIGATVYTTDIAIQLPLGEYNSTTNPTWDGVSSVYISEVGLFNESSELLAAGKFNYPVQKDSTKFRTILFSLDF
jgi:hypothetical protein